LRGHALLVTGVLAIILLAAVLYLWTAGKRGHAAPSAKVKSIAVLPFKTLAPTAQNEYLGVGLADVLITTLSNIKELNVRSTRSVLKYNESEADSVTAGRALKVDAVLEGSVQRIDDRIRVTVRLMNVQDEITLWGGKFDEPATDMLKVQDSIAERVARALLSSFNSKERGDVTKRYTDNGEAYHLYLKGRYFWNKRKQQDYLKAIDYYQQAIGKDSNYALAYAGLADAYSLLANDSAGQERQTQYEKARAAALKAQSPHVPLAVLRNLLMNRTFGCHCQAVLNSAGHDA
jgi:TolB-like protein